MIKVLNWIKNLPFWGIVIATITTLFFIEKEKTNWYKNKAKKEKNLRELEEDKAGMNDLEYKMKEINSQQEMEQRKIKKEEAIHGDENNISEFIG